MSFGTRSGLVPISESCGTTLLLLDSLEEEGSTFKSDVFSTSTTAAFTVFSLELDLFGIISSPELIVSVSKMKYFPHYIILYSVMSNGYELRSESNSTFDYLLPLLYPIP